jgi:phosphoribosyl 1,2-cyclic phosphate phosphodiesterase
MSNASTLRFTILGCASSAGVPRIGNIWGACDPENPQNRRRRCSLLIEKQSDAGSTNVLVDTGPDCREQLLDAQIAWLDGVVYTHAHADHVHGIDDLRAMVIHKRQRMNVYMDDDTASHITQNFRYCFETPEGSHYPPILNKHRIESLKAFRISGESGPIEITPFAVNHGEMDALGLRIGSLVYLPDVKFVPDAVFESGVLDALDMLIIDALRYTPHVSHFNVDDALGLIEKVKPKRAILTNMHIDLDYEALKKELPKNVEPAYDGLQILA